MDERTSGEVAGETAKTELEWHPVCHERDLPQDDTGLTVTVGGRALALFDHTGRLACIADTCPHEGASLGLGVALKGEVTCPWHGWHFELGTGANTDGLDECVAVHPVRRTAEGGIEVGLAPVEGTSPERQ